MLEQLLIPTVVLSVLGLLFGVGLGFAAKKFEVKADERVAAVRELLPGANCGACGYPGCDGMADAIVSGKAPCDGCPVASAEKKAQIAELMGATVAPQKERMAAKLICQGDKDTCKNKYEYAGMESCAAAVMVNDGPRSCQFGCIGFGDCINACKFDAITKKNGIIEIDPEKCTACGACIKECPKSIISLLPYRSKDMVQVLCKNTGFGKVVSSVCTKGCIGCQLCAKACPVGAITMENNLPVVDYDKCIGCMKCAEVCPQHTIYADFENRKVAEINDELCIGCTICKKQCKFDAIEGELKQAHKVDPAKCTGCGECAVKCPKKAIEMVKKQA